MNNGKILICNIIIAALAVVSIITLWVGSFMKIELKVNVNGDTMNSIIDKSKGDSDKGENAGDADQKRGVGDRLQRGDGHGERVLVLDQRVSQDRADAGKAEEGDDAQ